MYERLLVALDGSSAAERVLAHAEALATAFHSQLTLLRATLSVETFLAETATPETLGDVGPVLDPTPIVDADRDEAAAYLRGIVADLSSRGVAAETETPAGAPAEVIVERARDLGASLILMTTHGRGGIRRVVFGSVADRVLRHAPCPVLLVRVIDGGHAEAARADS